MASARDTGMLDAMSRSRWCTLALGLAAAIPAIASAEPEPEPEPRDVTAAAEQPATPVEPSPAAEAIAVEPTVTAVAAEPTPDAAPTTSEPSDDPPSSTTTSTVASSSESSPAARSTTAVPDSEATPASERKAKAARTEPPRLVLAGGLLLGPHAIGNEECDSGTAMCETKGSFFGVGGNLELRARLWRPLFLHLRGLAVRNVSNNDPIYGGIAGGGVGLGLYHRRIFGRGEYLLLHPFGDNEFEPPFFDGDVANDRWGNHAGTVSVGFRQPLPQRLTVELWGGVMIGPHSVRRVPQVEPDERVLTTFQIGVNLAWDAVP